MKQGTVVLIEDLSDLQEVVVAENEHRTVVIFLHGDQDHSGTIDIQIRGSGATVRILGIVIAGGSHTVTLHTVQHHRQVGSTSDLLIKSVLFGKTRFHYDGKIIIDPGAQQSNAYQKNQNLILSPHAWADSRPTLEIEANDVRCTHGATIGTVDEEQLYYLSSRGMSRHAATRLLVSGFLADVWQHIPDESM